MNTNINSISFFQFSSERKEDIVDTDSTNVLNSEIETDLLSFFQDSFPKGNLDQKIKEKENHSNQNENQIDQSDGRITGIDINSSNYTFLNDDPLQKLQYSIPFTSTADDAHHLNIHLSPVKTLEIILRQQGIQFGPKDKPIQECSIVEIYDTLLTTPIRGELIPSPIPDKKEDTDLKLRCTSLRTKYNIIPKQSWGSAEKNIQEEYSSLECDKYMSVDDSKGWRNQKQKNQKTLKFWEENSTKTCNLENYSHNFNFQSRFFKKIDQHIETYKYGLSAEEIDRESQTLRGVIGDDEYPIVSIMAGVTTRGSIVSKAENLVVLNYLIPSLFNTFECGYRYNIVLGYDKGDQFYDDPVHQRDLYLYFLKHFQIPLFLHAKINFNLILVEVDNVLKKPGPVFAEICKAGYFFLGSDWYFRVNDDSEIVAPWTSSFIKAVKGLGYPYGVIGPLCKQGNTKILTHDFVHRTHMHIFNYDYYPPQLVDWWMDDWISRVYGNSRTYQSKTVELLHHTHAAGQRYKVDKSNEMKLDKLVYAGKDKILQYMLKGPHPVEKAIVEKFKSSNFQKVPLHGSK